MAIYGPYTGNPEKANSYSFGPHWKNQKGYIVIKGTEKYNHRFGGATWEVPICNTCKEPYHQIFTFDLLDPKLNELKLNGLDELPLISCLNCSKAWEPQLFKIDCKNKRIINLTSNDSQHWEQDDDLKIVSPLPETSIKLEEMKISDTPVDETNYYKILDCFGEKYICRLLGAPLYIQGPIDRECPICKKEMVYISLIGSESSKGSFIEGIDFFLGEMSLYFMLCKDCLVIKTECQGT